MSRADARCSAIGRDWMRGSRMPHSIRLRPLTPRGQRKVKELQEAQLGQRAHRRQGEARGGSGEGAREARAVVLGVGGGGVVFGRVRSAGSQWAKCKPVTSRKPSRPSADAICSSATIPDSPWRSGPNHSQTPPTVLAVGIDVPAVDYWSRHYIDIAPRLIL